jgi:metallo-beta-lactamase class B
MIVKTVLLIAALPFCFGCAAEAAGEKALGDRVWISRLTKNTWRVRSISALEGFGDVESNAVVAAGPRESVLIDTPVTEKQTALVLDWAESQLQRPVRHLIATHWHADRMGGIDAAVSRGIATYALGRTIALAKQHGRTPPQHELHSEEQMTLAGVRFEVFYPGHGHTADNLIVWIPAEKVLDGGCFVKAAASTGLGNTQESDAGMWKAGIALVRKRYGSAAAVVPGHGDVGGPDLLRHTARLLDAPSRK